MPLAEWFASGRLIEIVVALMLLEFGVLVVLRRRGGGVPLAGLLAVLVAGACLMLAVRAALLDQSPAVITAWLVGGLVAHVADLAARWQRPVRGRAEPDRRDSTSGPQ